VTDDLSDDELLAALGAAPEPKSKSSRTPRAARVIAGFEDILKFHEEHGRVPQHGDDRDIFERIYAARLDALRKHADCRGLLAGLDRHGSLAGPVDADAPDDIDDDELLSALGVTADEDGGDIGALRHVKSREDVRTAEEIATRKPCTDFKTFEPVFETVREQIRLGVRETRRFEKKAEIEAGRFFIVSGLMAYVAEAGKEFTNDSGYKDKRLRVIYDNGTESDLLARSLQKALSQDEAGRRITDPNAGPLFSGEAGEGDLESGLIYVLRSLSDHPEIASRRNIVHKIGVTGSDLKIRIANAPNEATYLLAEVEIAATYRLFNINRTKLENLLHRIFSAARLDIEIEDRFGKPVRPREWFLTPLAAIDRAVELIRSGEIDSWVYDPATAKFEPSMR
jgi:T5orf172 domain